MIDHWSELVKQLSLIFPKISSTFNPPATEGEIDEFISGAGRKIPMEVFDYCRVFNGQRPTKEKIYSDGKDIEISSDVTFLDFFRINSLKEIQSSVKFLETHLYNHDIAQGEEMNGGIFWSKRYLPFATYIDGDWLSIDLETSDYKVFLIDPGGCLYESQRFPALDEIPKVYLRKLNFNEFELHKNRIKFL